MNQSFVSTRGYTHDEDFLDVVRLGLAPDGGLFVPAEIGKLSTDDLHSLLDADYRSRAAAVLSQFPLGGMTAEELKEIIERSYADNFDNEAIAPVVPLMNGSYLLELFHGPTAAFKDLALQCTPKLFSRAIRGRDEQYCILAATSGDTGVATIAGYAHETGTKVMVLYPDGGVSPVQEAQMLSLQNDDVRVCAVDADFDYCQRTAKQLFADRELATTLGDTRLSSANSMNWGRLLPQVAYWVSAYLDLVKQGVIQIGDAVDITVPTGNFGNILAAHYARLLGIPFRRFVVASNENNALTEFIQTGAFDLRDRQLRSTSSPSIDILVSSNAERLLYLITDGDTARVTALQQQLASEQYFELAADELTTLQQHYTAGWCSETDAATHIREVYKTSGYLLDTHTAVAQKVAEEHKDPETPMLIAATAHWAKFPAAVADAIGIETAGKTVAELHAAILARQPRPGMHRDIAAIGDVQTPPTKLPADYAAIAAALREFVA